MGAVAIRPFAEGEAAALAAVYHRAVHGGTGAYYDATQRVAWSPAPPAGPEWAARFEGIHTLVAEDAGAIVGFMTLDPVAGHIDLAFVLPEAAGQGTGARLLAMTEARAASAGLSRITTDASDAALPFFAAHGWEPGAREVVTRNGVALGRTAMAKSLAGSRAA